MTKVYKYLSIGLMAVLCLGGIFFYLEKSAHSKSRKELTNKIADLEGVIQETETAYSRRAIEIDNLKSKNSELQNVIEDRDEKIVSLTETTLQLKNKYFKIKDAYQQLVDKEGNVIESPGELTCEELESARFKVSFEHIEDPLKVTGHTLSNPAYAEVNLEWTRGLKLNIILAKTKQDTFRIYIDTDNSDIIPTDLRLSVDPAMFQNAWYERIGVGADIGVGKGVQSSIRIFYDVLPEWYVGPNISFYYDGEALKTLYGVSVGWYLFR